MFQTFKGKNILITGHTGFKGSWLSIWLKRLGANVIGYSLEPPTTPNLFELAELKEHIEHHFGDVRDLAHLKQVIQETKPDVIFHLAAQPIVLHGFENPHETFSVNAQGTVNLLEAGRHCDSLQAIVIITTDKCYENHEWVWGYRENDHLGGGDPYSASKAMAELATKAYRDSFFKGKVPIASARAGNVIGGGDFSDFRLIPDSMKALIEKRPIEVRNPESVRPWLHVLDPLHGYLLLAEKLIQEGAAFAEAWNFGPQEHEAVAVRQLVEKAIDLWGLGDWVDVSSNEKREMGLLKLNWDKAAHRLNWKPTFNWEQALSETVNWFKAFVDSNRENLYQTCLEQIEKYEIHTYPLERGLSHQPR